MALKISLVLLTFVSFLSTSKTLESEHFTLHYDDNIPLSVAEKLATRVNSNRRVVLAYLAQSVEYRGTPIKQRLQVYISKKRRTPYQDWNTIHIPERRVLSAFSEQSDSNSGMALIHELVHVYAVSQFRKQKKNGYEDRFFDDGLAVFMQHRFGEFAEYPDFGQDLYAAVAQLSSQYGKLIPLQQAEDVRHAAKTGIARKLAYLQEGAFTQFLIENYGLDSYLKIYAGDDIKTITGKSFQQLEQQWANLIAVFVPANGS